MVCRLDAELGSEVSDAHGGAASDGGERIACAIILPVMRKCRKGVMGARHLVVVVVKDWGWVSCAQPTLAQHTAAISTLASIMTVLQ